MALPKDPQALRERLRSKGVIPFAPSEWPRVAAAWREIERHATHFAGDLVILQSGDEFAALEQPSPERWLIHHLPDRESAREFVSERLAQYDRMWDGCGCKIDYESRWQRKGPEHP
jgi:hypothetical protein